MLIAFGLGEVVESWAKIRGATTLLGPGGSEFLARLTDALEDEGNEFTWQLQGFQTELAEVALVWFDAGDLAKCGFSNWEYITFSYRPDVWARTTWWMGHHEMENPVENWP